MTNVGASEALAVPYVKAAENADREVSS
jgi:hypothetical protein